MSDIKGVGIIICLLMVLMTYLKQVIPKGKSIYLMKGIISVFILLSFFDSLKNFDLRSIMSITDYSYSYNEEVWDKAAELIADGLKSEFKYFLESEKINAEVSEVRVEGNQDTFEVKKVILSGTDAETARNLLAGRYQIGIAYIEVKNE